MSNRRPPHSVTMFRSSISHTVMIRARAANSGCTGVNFDSRTINGVSRWRFGLTIHDAYPG
jgi:hypothetical protein